MSVEQDLMERHNIRERQALENLIAKTYFAFPYLIHPLRDQFPDSVREEYLRKLVRDLEKSEFYSGRPVWLSSSMGNKKWHCAFKRLAWDSDFFGFEIGRLEPFLHEVTNNITEQDLNHASCLAKHAVEEARRAGLQHLTASVDPADAVTIHALEEAGFRLKDTMVHHFFDTDKLPFTANGTKTRRAKDSDSSYLENLTVDCFADRTYNANRFSNDPQYPRDRISEMYKIWVRKSMSGERADIVLVAEWEGIPAGYLTGLLPTEEQLELGIEFGDMGIGAVDPKFHRLGLFRSLHQELVLWFKSKGIKKVQTRTALSTTGVNRACFRNGSTIACSPHTFHLNLTTTGESK